MTTSFLDVIQLLSTVRVDNKTDEMSLEKIEMDGGHDTCYTGIVSALELTGYNIVYMKCSIIHYLMQCNITCYNIVVPYIHVRL